MSDNETHSEKMLVAGEPITVEDFLFGREESRTTSDTQKGAPVAKEFTPTTEQVRSGFATDPYLEYLDPITNHTRVGEQVFDRWLAAHDAEVKVATLRRFATQMPMDVFDPRHMADLANAEADHIETEADRG